MSSDWARLVARIDGEYFHSEEITRKDFKLESDWMEALCENCDRTPKDGARFFAQVGYVDLEKTKKMPHDWPYSEITFCDDCLARNVLSYYQEPGSYDDDFTWIVLPRKDV